MQSEGISIQIAQTEVHLLPQKALYWPQEKTLLIADLHIGKGNHFRKNGIAIPSASQEKNWEKLAELLAIKELEKVIFLGDLFHSTYNEDCRLFADFVSNYPHLQFELVAGNHDILEPELYREMNIKLHLSELKMGPFQLTHEPIEGKDGLYNLAGHIHPGVKLRGKGKQSIRTACFYFGKKGGVLPAFGALTGTVNLKIKKGDQVYLIVEDQVIAAQ